MIAYLSLIWKRVCAVIDALRTSIGRPPTEGSVRLRLPSPHVKTVHWTVCIYFGRRPKLMLLPVLRFACAGDFAPCGERRGLLALDLARALPLNPASLSRKAGSKAFNFLRQYAQLSCAKMFSTISFILSSPKSSRSISTVEILV